MNDFSHQDGEVLLSIDNVNLSYGDKIILRDVNAQIRDIIRPGYTQGQVVGVLGPSGYGKTQLFRIIAGLNKPSSGSVLLGPEQEPTSAGKVGVVAQNYPLFEHRTVLGNLLLAATKKYSKGDAKAAIGEYLETFELSDKAFLYPSQLSGGQRQRIAIIQQLLCSDYLLLMDEPFSGLDLVMLEKVSSLISKVASVSEKNTIIVITHDTTAACSVADHLWLLGKDRDAEGNVIPGARIVQTYDLIERELCWHPEILKETRFLQFVNEVKERFRTL